MEGPNAGEEGLKGRNGAIRLLSELQQYQDGLKPPASLGKHANANGRYKSTEAFPTLASIPKYEHKVPPNQHFLGGPIWVESKERPGKKLAKPKAPRPQAAHVSAVAHEQEERRLSTKATMGKVGDIIFRRRQRRSASAMSSGDVLSNLGIEPEGAPFSRLFVALGLDY